MKYLIFLMVISVNAFAYDMEQKLDTVHTFRSQQCQSEIFRMEKYIHELKQAGYDSSFEESMLKDQQVRCSNIEQNPHPTE